MPATPEQTRLSRSRHVTLVLRLVVDARGKLLYGQVVNTEGQTQCRFINNWRALSKAVRSCLASLAAGFAPDSVPAAPLK